MFQGITLDDRLLGYAVWQDVTDQVHALNTLREREADLVRVQRIGKIGGFEVNLTDGFIKHRSAEYAKLDGQPAELIEHHDAWMNRLHPDDRERADRVFRETVNGAGVNYASEYRIIKPDGEIRWISAIGEIERDAAGRPIRMFGAHSDVTDLRRAETVLSQQAVRLQEADRQKDEFLAMLGHELRNPLAALLAASEVLQRAGLDLPPEIARAHQVIDRNLAQFRLITGELLDMARVRTGKLGLNLEIIDISTVVRTALEQTSDQIEQRGLQREVVLPEMPVFVAADGLRLVQVVSNLLNNAAKFTQAGGLNDSPAKTAFEFPILLASVFQ